jgi:hypothetical protein
MNHSELLEGQTMQFQDDELAMLYRTLDDKLGSMFSSRLVKKAKGSWNEFDEELYWTEYKKHKPLWDKLHKLVKG